MRYKNLLPEQIWALREKVRNTKNPVLLAFYKHRYKKTMTLLGSFMPERATFADMPAFPHGINGILVSGGAVIGSGCTIFHQVTIGSNLLEDTAHPGAPVIGDNVYIGAGAKIIGGVRVGNNVRIGANCVVVTDIPDNATVVLEKPKIIVHDHPKNNVFVRYSQSRLGGAK